MDRALRIIGIAIVVALPVFAYRAFDGAVSAAPADVDPVTERNAGLDGDVDADGSDGSGLATDESPVALPAVEAEQLDADGQPPEYLAFDAGLPPMAVRAYPVADDPDVRDRDVEPDRDPNEIYPTETDLFGGFSLASTESIEPGLYASAFTAEGCSYELRRINRSGDDRLIGQERLASGRLLVSIDPIEPDVFSSVPQCRSWTPWSPLVEPLVSATAGDYWIGDLAMGTWSVPDGCLWEKVVAFRGARLADVTDSGRGPTALIVDRETLGVRIRDCASAIELTEAAAPQPLDFEPGLDPGQEP